MKNLAAYFFLLFIALNVKAQTIQEIIAEGDQLCSEGKYTEAVDLFEKTVKSKSAIRDTNYVNLLNQLAWVYVDLEEYSKAESKFLEGKNLTEKLLGKNSENYSYSCSFLSLLYYYQGLDDKAEPLCIEAKNIREKVMGKDNLTYANSCKNLGDIYVGKGDYKKAEPLYLEAKTIREKVGGKDHPDYQKSCITLSNFYHDLGMYAKAEFFYIENKNINEKKVGKESIVYAKSCHNLAALYLDQGAYAKAEALFVESKGIIEKVSGKESADYAFSCNSLANVYFNQSQYKKAEPLYMEAKNIFEKIGKDNFDYISSCNNLAGLYAEEGAYNKAEQLYIEAKKIQEKITGKNNAAYALACNNLGSLYAKKGTFNKAESLFFEAKNTYEQTSGKDNLNYALSCRNIGTLYLDQGFYAKAEPFYIEAKNINEKILGKNHLDYASACNSLANLYTDQGLYSKAEPLYIEAKDIREKVLGKGHSKYATICNNLANLYFSQRLYNKAEPLYIEAKDIQEKVYGKNHASYAMSCNNLGALYYRQGLYSKAAPFYEEAIAIQEKVYGKFTLNYAMSCSNLASLYRRQGLYSKSEAYYIEAKNLREKIVGKAHPDYANSCNNLANLYMAQKMIDKAGPLYKEAINNKLKQIDEVLPTLSEREREEFFRSIDYYFKRYYYFVLNANQQALYTDLFNLQLSIKGLIFQSTQKMQNQIMNSGNDALIQKYQDWKSQRAFLNKYMQLTIAERTQKGLNTDSMLTLINDLEKSLSLESELFAQSRKKQKYTWQDVQKKLLPNEAAVEIIRTDSAYIALIVKPTTKDNPEAVIFAKGEEMDKRFVKYYRTCIAHKIEDELSYDNFWKPIQEKLGSASHVYLSADGVYHQINLLTLKNPVSKKYVLNETNIQLLSNLKDLLTVQKNDLAQQYENYKIHLIAYPKYDVGVSGNENGTINMNESLKSDTSQRFYSRGGEIAMLPGTKEEAGYIVGLCTKLNIKTELKLLEEASEAYLKSLNNPSILHIATHGFFMSSDEVSKNNRGLTDEETKEYRKDPLHNSGLLLANAQQGMSGQVISGEDGILTAKEALNLNLDKTDLVIMSACETGLGEIRNGEGVYGLQRSFQQAGAKTVIISLWKVSDEATQQLMSNFYTNLLEKKMAKREAFKQAQTALMQKYPEPYFWGAFVMIGE
jgi:CHAT domain-containing protein